jgi:hypothetical protein
LEIVSVRREGVELEDANQHLLFEVICRNTGDLIVDFGGLEPDAALARRHEELNRLLSRTSPSIILGPARGTRSVQLKRAPWSQAELQDITTAPRSYFSLLSADLLRYFVSLVRGEEARVSLTARQVTPPTGCCVQETQFGRTEPVYHDLPLAVGVALGGDGPLFAS